VTTSYKAAGLLLAALILLLAASAAALEAGIDGSLPAALAGAVAFFLSLVALSGGLFRLSAASSSAGRSD
jgi:hypothetical protein